MQAVSSTRASEYWCQLYSVRDFVKEKEQVLLVGWVDSVLLSQSGVWQCGCCAGNVVASVGDGGMVSV